MPLGVYLLLLVCVVGGLKSVEADLHLEVVVMASSAAEFNTSGVIPVIDHALETVNNWSLPFNLSHGDSLDSKV